MACACAPTLVRLRNEFNERFPNRDKSSDGCCGDAAHAARTSDHNPTNGYAHAQDIDEDLQPGDPNTRQLDWFRQFIFDNPGRYPQVKYLIYEREIWYPHDGARKRGKYAYTGPNAHDHHLHVSIFTTHTNFYGRWLPTPAPGPQEGFLMALTEQEQRDLKTEVHNIQEAVGQRLNARLSDVLDAIAALERRVNELHPAA